MVQTLTVDAVKKAARKFYKAGKLTAQHPKVDRRQCIYQQGRTYRCAVGAAFNDTTMKSVINDNANDGVGVVGLVSRGLVKIPNDDIFPIKSIQEAHDGWCDFGNTFSESNFRKLIGLKEAA